MRISLYSLFLSLSVLLLPGVVAADQESDIAVPVASDLSQLAAQSSQRKVPILLSDWKPM